MTQVALDLEPSQPYQPFASIFRSAQHSPTSSEMRLGQYDRFIGRSTHVRPNLGYPMLSSLPRRRLPRIEQLFPCEATKFAEVRLSARVVVPQVRPILYHWRWHHVAWLRVLELDAVNSS